MEQPEHPNDFSNEKDFKPDNPNMESPLSINGDTELHHDIQLVLLQLKQENNELRKTRSDLERSLVNFTNLFDFAPTAYFTLDQQLHITEANHAACDQLNLKRDELIGLSFIRFVAAEQADSFHLLLKELGIHAGRNTIDLNIIKPNGEQVFYHIECVATTTSKGQIAFRLIATDLYNNNIVVETMARSLDFQQALLDDIPSLFWRAGVSGKVDYFNKTWFAFTGRTSEQEDGDGWLTGIHPEDREAFIYIFKNAFNNRQSFSTEFRLRRQDGVFRRIVANGQPFLNLNKQFAGFICSCHDIDDRVQAESIVKQQNIFLNNVIESLTHPFCVIDVETYKIIQANSASVNLYGDIESAFCYTVNHGANKPCDTSSHLCPLNLVRNSHQSAKVEHIHRDKNGNERIMDVYCYPIFDEGGKLIQVIEYALDTTERKQAEHALQIELEMSRALAEISIDTLSSPLSRDETTLAVHRHALALTGRKMGFTGALNIDRTVRYTLGDTFTDIKGCPRIEELPEGMAEVWLAACKEPRQEGEMSLTDHNSGITNKIYSVPAIAGGEVLGIIVLFTNEEPIDQKVAEIIHRLANLYALALHNTHTGEELKAAKEKAEESDRLKSMFLSNMSHDIRTPMNAIVGFSEMLQDPDLTREERNRFLDIIINSGDALLRLINDIIDISKIEAGQLKIIKSDFSLNEMLSDLYLSFAEDMSRNKIGDIKLILNKQFPDKDFMLHSDIVRFIQIFSNLLGNALKFTDKGCIEFGYTIPDPKVFRFFVKDTGIGIPHDKTELIFERFGQIEETQERNKGGTGLGLTISKSLAELLGGAMWVESEVGLGTTFYFTLPLASGITTSSPPSEGILELSNTTVDWSDKVILVAEDVDSNFFLIQTILSKTGVKLIWAKNGQEAHEMCRNNFEIDLVLMDIQMPIMSGYDATREIKKIRPSLPVIAQTAYAMSGEKEKTMEAGCDDYIPKPLKKRELIAKIHRFLQS
jgi:PAS domain S-box-containing protein